MNKIEITDNAHDHIASILEKTQLVILELPF